jgi:hypothetical protein
MKQNNDGLIFYTASDLTAITNASPNLDLEDEIKEWLIKLFGSDNIPEVSPILRNYILRKIEEKNVLMGLKSRFAKTSMANLENFSLAKTNVFLRNIMELKKDGADMETMKRYANLVLVTQQTVEENHVAHTTTNIANVADTETGELLLYVSEGDSKTRHDHKLADGTCLPKSDPFWNEAFKLLSEYNCRCTIITSKNHNMKPAPNIVVKETTSPAEIDIQSGKAILFKEDLGVFQNASPVVRRQFKRLGF